MTAVELPPADALLFGRVFRVTTLGAVALISLLAFESLAVTTAMPALARDLDGLALYSVAFSASMAASVVGMVAAGGISDRRGPALPLQSGVLVFAAGLVVAGAAPSMWVVVAGRLLQGCGTGLAMVAVYVVVARIYPAELRPRLFAVFSAAWVVPSIVGPGIAGLVVEHAGWRWVFLGVPLLALLATALLQPALRRLRAQERATAAGRDATAAGRTPGEDADGAPAGGADASAPRRRVGWAVGAAAGAVGLQAGAEASTAVAIPLVTLGAATLLLSAWRLLPGGTLRAGAGLPATILLRGLITGGFFSTEVYLPLLLVREHDLSPAVAGLVLTAGALGWSAGSWWQGRVSRPGNRRALVRVGSTLLLLGIASQALLLVLDAPAPFTVLGWTVAGLGIGLTYSTCAVLVLELSPPARQGENSAALQLSEALLASGALAIGGIVFGLLVADHQHTAFLAAFGLAAVWALGAAATAQRVRESAP
ncbi:MFS transporter [Conexibacter sp. JD483]|uniref:MFS transporter n=1 Tax=Conexibacter sp. JD483 TaxID=3064471 RepID=UPI002870AB83|nr:MFS transporter [Conexibacter sp. JD483]MDR9372547.1 MFS transporter [Conexibacter sp. JD483]